MKLQRYFFISEDLDVLEALEKRLEDKGVSRMRIHILSEDDSGVERHTGLHAVESIMKTDLFHSGVVGLLLGVCAAALFLGLVWYFGWNQLTEAGWLPFGFGAFILMGFFMWEGGLLGIQTHNHHFREFEQALNTKKHVFFVDLEPEFEGLLDEFVKNSSAVKRAGVAKAPPRWLLVGEQKISHFVRETLP